MSIDEYVVVKTKSAVALTDLECKGGINIKKGQIVRITLAFCERWAADGYRTFVGPKRLGFITGDVYDKSFSKSLLA